MPNGADIIELAIHDFQKVQAHMFNAKKKMQLRTCRAVSSQ